MSEAHTVTRLLKGIIAGDEEAIDELTHLYLERLVEVGRNTYHRTFLDIPRPVEDEEDAALSALASFFVGIREGKFNDLANRQQLLKLLVKITVRKIYDQRERATAMKRGGKEVPASPDALGQVISKMPGPEVEAQFADTLRAAMEQLTDPESRRIAQMDLEGRSPAEIAKALDVTDRTVYRKLAKIRKDLDRSFAADR